MVSGTGDHMTSNDLRKMAARNAACSITVGILLDQVRLMRQGKVLIGAGQKQAVKVERWCQEVLDSIPRLSSAKGLRNLQDVCDLFELQFAEHWPHLARTSAMSACAAIFTTHLALTELRRIMGLKSARWKYLDQTATTLLELMLADIPEEEARMFEAAGPVVARVVEVAA